MLRGARCARGRGWRRARPLRGFVAGPVASLRKGRACELPVMGGGRLSNGPGRSHCSKRSRGMVSVLKTVTSTRFHSSCDIPRHLPTGGISHRNPDETRTSSALRQGAGEKPGCAENGPKTRARHWALAQARLPWATRPSRATQLSCARCLAAGSAEPATSHRTRGAPHGPALSSRAPADATPELKATSPC